MTEPEKSRSLSPPSTLQVPLAARSRRRSSNSVRPAAKPPISTHSPIALAAAAAITPDRLRQLLTAQGPLPIRHITSHLAQNVQGFGDLSLSKQRRLIIAVLENGDPSEGVEFEKVGWGRWAVQGDERARDTPEEDDLEMEGVPKVEKQPKREPRGSISSQLPRHKLPLSPSLTAVEDAVFSDSEEANTDEEDWGLKSRENEAVQALVDLSSTPTNQSVLGARPGVPRG